MTVAGVPAALPSRGGWGEDARPDPITGLVAFPDFHAALPLLLTEALVSGRLVGVAIGDVDHLKRYVEGSNAADPAQFGHLAGNAFMARLGVVCTSWFREQPFPSGCVSTFGGDEVIVAVTLNEREEFPAAIAALRDRCSAKLPRTVSFALAVVSSGTPGVRSRLVDPVATADLVLAGVDRTLFRRKAARRRRSDDGFVAAVELDLETGKHAVA